MCEAVNLDIRYVFVLLLVNLASLTHLFPLYCSIIYPFTFESLFQLRRNALDARPAIRSPFTAFEVSALLGADAGRVFLYFILLYVIYAGALATDALLYVKIGAARYPPDNEPLLLTINHL